MVRIWPKCLFLVPPPLTGPVCPLALPEPLYPHPGMSGFCIPLPSSNLCWPRRLNLPLSVAEASPCTSPANSQFLTDLPYVMFVTLLGQHRGLWIVALTVLTFDIRQRLDNEDLSHVSSLVPVVHCVPFWKQKPSQTSFPTCSSAALTIFF